MLVSRCRLDVIALTWSSLRSGVWEVVSRLWSRPTPTEYADGGPFAPGEPLPGLSLPEQLLEGGTILDDLGKLFNPNAAVAATKEVKAQKAFCCQNGVAEAPFRSRTPCQ